MPSFSAPYNFFTNPTRFVLGQGGIIWEATGKLLRSGSDGTEWTVKKDFTVRNATLATLNVNWRGGFIDPPTNRKPAYELAWRGEQCRHWMDWNGWLNGIDFALNGTVYQGALVPGGEILGGGVYTPTSSSVEQVPYLYLVHFFSSRLVRKKLSDLNNSNVAWEDLGILPGIVGTILNPAWGKNTHQGVLRNIRSIFFHPNGNEFVTVRYRYRNVNNLDPICGFAYYRWSLNDTGLIVSNLAAEVQEEFKTRRTQNPQSSNSNISLSLTHPTQQDGSGSATLDVYDSASSAITFSELVNGSVTLKLAADYTPQGDLVFFTVDFDFVGEYSTSSNYTVGPEEFEGPFPPAPFQFNDRYWYTWDRREIGHTTQEYEVVRSGSFAGHAVDLGSYHWEKEFFHDALVHKKSSLLYETNTPGIYYWLGTPPTDQQVGTTLVTLINEGAGAWNPVEIQYADLRYGILIYTRYTDGSLVNTDFVNTVPTQTPTEWATHVVVNGVSQQILSGTSASAHHPRRWEWILWESFEPRFGGNSNYLGPSPTITEYPVDLLQPIFPYPPAASYGDDPMYNGIFFPNRAVIGLDLNLSMYVKPPYEGWPDYIDKQFCASNPQGGYAIILESFRGIRGVDDPLFVFYGKQTEDLEALLVDADVTVTFSIEGHQFAHVLK